MVPAPICAYNKFMNSVDCMDQLRPTNPTRRCEQRLEMSLFTFILDASCLNAYAVYKVLYPLQSHKVGFREFKRRICEGMCTPQLKKRAALKVKVPTLPKSLIDDSSRLSDTEHMLIENIDSSRVECFLCRYTKNIRKTTRYTCVGCLKGFCVNCFTALLLSIVVEQ